ncbi:MAG: hypothetical protein H6Q89_3715, partial [Myxococcaceae bacterium]|nr:hypothetical protein [Myxococcaceae bacterium]
MKAWDDAKAAVKRAMNDLATMPTLASLGLPLDMLEKVKRFPAEQQKRDDALQKVLDEQQAAEESRASVSVPSLQKDPRFVGSVAAGVLLVATGA